MAIAISLLAGLMVALSFCGAWIAIAGAGGRALQKRARRQRTAGRGGRPSATKAPQLRREHIGVFDIFAKRFLPHSEGLRVRLLASGTGWSVGRYSVICVSIGAVSLVLLLMLGAPSIAAALASGATGLGMPHMVTGVLLKRRRDKFSKLLPEAIGLMVRGLKAGLPVTDTILVIGREVSEPVGEEFRFVADQVKLGQPIEEALWAVARRLNLAEFNFLVITVSVQRETGGNLAETLQTLEATLRKRQQMRLKIKAMSAEAVASAGIIGSLPFIMSALLFFISRAYVMALFTTSLGLTMTAIGVASLAMGIFVMARMVAFEL